MDTWHGHARKPRGADTVQVNTSGSAAHQESGPAASTVGVSTLPEIDDV